MVLRDQSDVYIFQQLWYQFRQNVLCILLFFIKNGPVDFAKAQCCYFFQQFEVFG